MIIKCVLLLSALGLISDNDLEARLPYFLAYGLNSPNGVKNFFKDISKSQVERLAVHSNAQISIYAKWIIQNEEERSFSTVEQKQLSRAQFCGFLSGRLVIPFPDWWTEFLLHSKLDFSIHSYKEFSETDDVRHPTGLKINELTPEYISLESEGRQMVFDGTKTWWDSCAEIGTFFKNDSNVDCIALQVARDGQRLLAVLPIDGSPTLFCTDKSGLGLWKADVRKCRQIEGSSKLDPRGLVGIYCFEDKVAVFWRNVHEVTLDVFDLYTGAQKTSFTTLIELRGGRSGLPLWEENRKNEKLLEPE